MPTARPFRNITIQFESRRTSKDSAAQNLARMKSQLEQFQVREKEIQEQLAMSQAPLAENKALLEQQLETRVAVEKELGAARQLVENVEAELRELDQMRMQIDQTVDENRHYVSEAEMAARELRVRREGVADQLTQTGFDFEVLIAEMDQAANIADWEERLEKLRRRIDRLGPINLAAIDEFKEQSERKEYLDAQLDDLQNALATLEGAIRKIDRETKARFRETFSNVNEGFKNLFPKLFGGGHAYLELTGDDLLSAGVTVMARPPGKRNSTIHLLSGGEKALTAVALVFSIFRAESGTILPPGRGRCAVGRRERGSFLRDRTVNVRQGSVCLYYAQQGHHGTGKTAYRRHYAGTWCLTTCVCGP